MLRSPTLPPQGAYLGRAASPRSPHPLVVTVREGEVWDITSREAPLVRDICEMEDPAAYVRQAKGKPLGAAEDLAENSFLDRRDAQKPFFLSPIDLQAVKAAGVTFAASLVERVIEERARGNPAEAEGLRAEIDALIGPDLSRLKPGSPEAMALKETLIARNMWSQYLEVGIGPDAEIFTKCQPLASVGFGADVGLHPVSDWNNPEPEIAVVASSAGRIVGATLGNDVNLRDVEGRSALLLGKAKDNNASASLGPMIRLFDESFGLEDVKSAEVRLTVEGGDGFSLEGASSMRLISRAPEELVAAACGPHHQYPDGFVLYLGTMFVPAKDRDEKGRGFTHREGDLVAIETPALGRLVNRVRRAPDCPPWTYGARALMADLARAGLL